ncbi:hypothetical protein [Demequina subtropica]|uniref:hypothetical protein n=1 Tax=Demequina subtropica TaxID=1638989 RepID=UPI00078449A7|nr:hypothetical protein [Demequina subtropica]
MSRATGFRATTLMVIMAAAILVASLVWWFTVARGDGEARSAAAAAGIVASADSRVSQIDGGFHVSRDVDTSGGLVVYAFDLVEQDLPFALPDDAAGWAPFEVRGADAYAVGDPIAAVHIDAGSHAWTVTNATSWYADDGSSADEVWALVPDMIAFEALG